MAAPQGANTGSNTDRLVVRWMPGMVAQGEVVKLPAPNVSLVKLQLERVVSSTTQQMVWQVSVVDLQLLLEQLVVAYGSKLVEVQFTSRGFPYRYGQEYLLSQGVPMLSDVEAVRGASGKVHCRMCPAVLAANALRHHVGGHLLMGKGGSNTCGLCGGIMQPPADGAPGRCVASLVGATKGGGEGAG
jgi:hypothetical protein